MYELLEPENLSAQAALQKCRSALARRWRRFGIAHALLSRAERDDFVALFAWHELVRACMDKAIGDDALRNTLGQLRLAVDQAFRGRGESAIAAALAPTIRDFQLSALSFTGMLEEHGRRDLVRTFETRNRLLRHARHLVSPESRMLLRVCGLTAERDEIMAEALALGLQLTAWIGRFAFDLERGQLHFAVEDLSANGIDILSLRRGIANVELSGVVRDYIGWARELLAKGWPLCTELGRWRGRQLAFVLRWHAATLSAIEARHYDIARSTPTGGYLRISACLAAVSIRSSSPF